MGARITWNIPEFWRANTPDDTKLLRSVSSPGLLADMKREFPDRFYMEGVCEQNVIGLAAGLALEGYIPYVNTIATFLTRRCFEQVAVDLCLHDLPVRLIANGGGLVYAPFVSVDRVGGLNVYRREHHDRAQSHTAAFRGQAERLTFW